jgi:hypothetical protein
MAHIEDSNKKREELESIALKGIGVELQKLHFPKMMNLQAMVNSLGYELVPIDKQISLNAKK